MDEMKRAAIVTKLVEQLWERGSWCGETHIQKSTYFLQELTNVPLGFGFIMYKHGPYSFDLSAAIVEHRADQLLELERREYPYGPSLRVAPGANRIWSLFPKTLSKRESAIQFVANQLGDKNVVELEQLATALFVFKENVATSDRELVAQMLEFKPHVSREAAQAALAAVREMQTVWTKEK